MAEDRRKLQVKSNVKDESLVEIRRQQILQASILLFREKGFHRATTREIAKAAGFSIGTLYEYVRTKEDVLYLICDNISVKVNNSFAPFPEQNATIEDLEIAIANYIRVVDTMLDEFTIMYQETKSLPKEAMRYVLNKELEMVGIFEQMLKSCVISGKLKLTAEEIFLAANQILVMGQSWAFRKWAIHARFTLSKFIEHETKLLLQGLARPSK